MKALSLTQPWASLIAWGIKRIETRSWATRYRGPLAIHAARAFPRWAVEFCASHACRDFVLDHHQLPRQAIVALVRLVDVRPTSEVMGQLSLREAALGDYGPGRYAWVLDDIRCLREPIALAGALGLWEVPEGLWEEEEAGRVGSSPQEHG